MGDLLGSDLVLTWLMAATLVLVVAGLAYALLRWW